MNGQVAKPLVSSYLAFSPLPVNRRYISVALSLESPPPDVIRHSYPMELGLSSYEWALALARSHMSYSLKNYLLGLYNILPQLSHSLTPDPESTRLIIIVGKDILQPPH